MVRFFTSAIPLFNNYAWFLDALINALITAIFELLYVWTARQAMFALHCLSIFLAFVGILRWQNRIWSLVSEFVKQKKLHKDNSSQTTNTAELKQIELDIHDARNYFLLEVNCHNC